MVVELNTTAGRIAARRLTVKDGTVNVAVSSHMGAIRINHLLLLPFPVGNRIGSPEFIYWNPAANAVVGDPGAVIVDAPILYAILTCGGTSNNRKKTHGIV